MKIVERPHVENLENTVHTKATGRRRTGKENGAGRVSNREKLDSAQVRLSERARDMKKIREHVNRTPDVDEAKVAKYRSMLKAGTYKVNSKAVADKMVDEHAYNDFFDAHEEE